MPTCSVSGCSKAKRDAFDPDHKFFSFPKKSPLIEKWIKFCRKDSLTKEQCLTKGHRVCSIHFKEEYIEIPLKYRLLPQFAPKNMRTLRKDAVPTIRNPKKRKEDEEDEKEKTKKKLEYSRIVAELLEQSEKDAAAEKERQENEAAVNDNESPNKTGSTTQQNMKQEESTPPSKKTPKSKKQSPSNKQKSPKKLKTEPTSPDTTKDLSKTGNNKSVASTKNLKSNSGQKKKVSFAETSNQLPDTDDDIEVFEPDFQSEDTENDVATKVADQLAEDNAAEMLRLQRENKKLTDLTIKQSMQIADLIKQRNDLWREKGDLWFRKRMDPQSGVVTNVS